MFENVKKVCHVGVMPGEKRPLVTDKNPTQEVFHD